MQSIEGFVCSFSLLCENLKNRVCQVAQALRQSRGMLISYAKLPMKKLVEELPLW